MAGTIDHVEKGASNEAHREGAPAVIDDAPRTETVYEIILTLWVFLKAVFTLAKVRLIWQKE